MKAEDELKRRCGMKPYSIDLRQRIAAAVDHGEGSFRQIARRFRVSLSFIARLLRRRRQTGTLEPKPHGGGHPPALDLEGEDRLRELALKPAYWDGALEHHPCNFRLSGKGFPRGLSISSERHSEFHRFGFCLVS